MKTPESKIIETNTYCWACSHPTATYDFNGITSCGECGAGKEPQSGEFVPSREKKLAFLLLGLVAIIAFVAFIGGMLWLISWWAQNKLGLS